jgi:hypothetical protein
MQNVEYKKLIAKRNFGIELEVGNEVPLSLIRETIACNSYVPVKSSYYRATLNNNYWEVKHDGSCGRSVDKFGINEGGYEVTTFKAQSVRDLLHICQIGRKIKQIGCSVNKNCGLHVHIDVSDFDTTQLGVLIGYWLCIEKIIMQAVPNSRKNNKFCVPLSTLRPKFNIELTSPTQVWMHYKPYSAKLHDNFDRRCAMNLVNYYRSMHIKNFKRPTIEFRFPEGTLVSKTIKNWTRIFINFVNSMKDKKFELTSIRPFSLEETLEVLGLSGGKDSFYILSAGLYESKVWLLKRIIRYATYPHHELLSEAKKLLQDMETNCAASR